MESDQILVTPAGRVRRYRQDMAGNRLDAALMWCASHFEPVWVYDDGSYECPQTRIVEFDDHTHVIVEAPWEDEK